MWVATAESDALSDLARYQRAAEVAVRGLETARQTGLGGLWEAAVAAANAAEALMAQGRTAEAAALIDPLTSGPPDRDHWVVHEFRAEVDLLRGDIEAATRRQQQVMACAPRFIDRDFSRERTQLNAELALWAAAPPMPWTRSNRCSPPSRTRT